MFEEISIVETYTYGSSARACSSPCSWSNSPPPPSRLIELPSCFMYNQQKHVKKFETQNRIEFPGNQKILETPPKTFIPKRRVCWGCFGGLPKPLSMEELFVAPRHGVAIKGGADLTLTGSGFVYPAVRAPLDGTGMDGWGDRLTLRGDWSLGILSSLEFGIFENRVPFFDATFFFGIKQPSGNIV